MQIQELKIPLSNNKKKAEQLILVLLFVISGLWMGYLAVIGSATFIRSLFAIGAGINLLSVAYFLRKTDNNVFPALVILVINAIILSVSGNWLVAIMFLLSAASLYVISKSGFIGLSDKGITLPVKGIPFYKWSEVESVVLRDRLITFNLQSDQTFQFEIDRDWDINRLEKRIEQLRRGL